jgi:deoxyadenosine/deoxycytidine kinase
MVSVSFSDLNMIVVLDGNIGAGKSSMLSYLRDKHDPSNLHCSLEPVALWRNVGGTDLLTECYAHKENSYFQAQSYIMSTMAELYSNKDENVSLNIFERSIFSTHKIFTQHFLNNNFLSKTEFHILEQQFELYVKTTPTPDVFIYLRCDPDTCLERIAHRGGLESGGTVSLEYLKNIHKLYDNFYLGANNRISRVIIVDSSGPKETVQFLLDLTIDDLFA